MEKNKINILIVEDNPGDVRFVAEMLKRPERDAFSLTPAGRIDEALTKLAGTKFDVVLLDLNLPDSREFEGLDIITKQYPELPVIVLTGADDETLGLQAIQRHAADYLIKGQIGISLLTHSIRYAIERKHAEETLAIERHNLQMIFDAVSIGMLLIDEQCVVKRVNNVVSCWIGKDRPAVCKAQPGDILGCIHALNNPAGCGQTPHCDTCPIRNAFESVLRSGQPVHGAEAEAELLIAGTPARIWLDVSADPVFIDKKKHAILSLNDITRRKQAEQELHRLNRTLKALSNSNQAMMRAKDESSYLNAVCQIIVKDCGHTMVWTGLAEEDEAKTVRPVAQAGFEHGYLKTLNITWDDTERGRGPTGTAIRTGKPALCRNMLTDPDFEPWRNEALKRGYASSLVLPLIADNKTLGAINIYSREPDSFSKDEINLLGELADDLAYGITAIRLRTAHQQAERELQKSKTALQKSYAELEIRVKERTAELSKVNKDLNVEIAERKRMAAEMEKYQTRLRALAERLSSTEERERRRISSQIHDTVIQTLSLSNIKMGSLYKELTDARLKYSAIKLNEIRATIEEAIRESRSLMAELTPPLLYELGMMPALTNLAQKLQQQHNTPIQVKDDGQPKPMDKALQGLLFQAIRELIMNALKHAGKCNINVDVSTENNRLQIYVKDDGAGFDASKENLFTFHDKGGFGLFTIRERLESIGGGIDIRSRPGSGTSVALFAPLKPKPRA